MPSTRWNLHTSFAAVAAALTICVSSATHAIGQDGDIVLGNDDFAPAKPAAAEFTRADLVREQLAAGEFGPALQTARAAEDAGERAELVKLVAEAQVQAGDFDSALKSLRGATDNNRPSAGGSRNQLGGGASLADFQPLMDLIRDQTSPPALWQATDGEGGSMSPFLNGVLVEPGGVLRQATRTEMSGRLNELANRARAADLNEDMAQPSDLRLISLRRLERAVRERLADGQPVVETMRNLAGLVRVRYVFVLEDDVLIGGPAEPWEYDRNAQTVGAVSGRPTLQLDDLVTLLRTFSQSGTHGFLCSIDPRPEGMQALTSYVDRTNGSGVSNVRGWTRTLQNKLGMQDVRLDGIPSDSRIARVIVEADYRMKLIGIGKLAGVPGMKSFFDLLPQAGSTSSSEINALRWWLTMNYDAILHDENRRAFEFQGSSVLCLSENELVTAQGQRVATGQSEPVNRLFAKKFTDNYDALAARDLVFADLQNVFDLALVAALIWDEQVDRRIGWNRGAFRTNGGFEAARHEPPKEVMSVVNHRIYNGKDIVVQVAGGVQGDLMKVVRDRNKRQQQDVAVRADVRPDAETGAQRWWWDAQR